MDVSNNYLINNQKMDDSNDDTTDESYDSFDESIDVTTISESFKSHEILETANEKNSSEPCLSTSSKKFLIDNILGLEKRDRSDKNYSSDKSDNNRTKKYSEKFDSKFFKPAPVSVATHSGNSCIN